MIGEGKIERLRSYVDQFSTKNVVTITDLQELEYNGVSLSPEQERALANFNRYRIRRLTEKSRSEKKFHEQFEYVRALGNIVGYEEFLKEEYR